MVGKVALVYESPVGTWNVAIVPGANEGIEKGDEFKVLDDPIEINDLDGTFLGNLERTKAIIGVRWVERKYAICDILVLSGGYVIKRGDVVEKI